MRDPSRIDKVLAALGDTWKQNPDLRLGQLLLNVYRDPALYYIEDDQLVNGVKHFYDELDIRHQMQDNDAEYEIGSLIQHMRNATEEEHKAVNDYIDSVAVPTGRTIWNFYKDE